MTQDWTRAPLVAYLKKVNDIYFGKAAELREVISGWLSYIPATFPHYTGHTVDHSERIVRAISHVLFKDDDPNEPQLSLSGVEAYSLVAAAFLHDAGMVVSNREATELLQSEEWKDWVAANAQERMLRIEQLRTSTDVQDTAVRNFLADVQLRFLIAEFVRRTHHSRSGEFVTAHADSLDRVSFGDPLLARTIGDICAAHGLPWHQLEDQERFPDRRTIRGDQINVRLMAILIRLGDLLDISSDRACPLLLNANCPLPFDSYAHWSKHQRLAQFMVAPDRIEITAECDTQEEHRLWRDWCQWVVDECRNANTLVPRCRRHAQWRAPEATLEGSNATIVIRPSQHAKYTPCDWIFEIDRDIVVQRFIQDIYHSPEAFVRELIQNALDATRCQMERDLRAQGQPVPDSPTRVPDEIRARYPLSIKLETQDCTNDLSGMTERRQVLRVEDHGIGMTQQIIERYFLQIGRSYYTTPEFRRSFTFTPISRFGVGFLSVFAASDHVVVETLQTGSPDGPIKLTLTGPRSYLLREKGARASSGTCIAVTLREPMETGDLTKLVKAWCPRVEFPIEVDDLGSHTVVAAETPALFTYDILDPTNNRVRFAVRSFPVDRPGIEGELYVFARTDKDGESWASTGWARYTYPTSDPLAISLPIPASLICYQGIAVGRGGSWENKLISRIDYRGDSPALPSLTVSRREVRHRRGLERDPRLDSRWSELLAQHLAGTPRAQLPLGWRYKQRLVDAFPVEAFWETVDGTIPVVVRGQAKYWSLREMKEQHIITTVDTSPRRRTGVSTSAETVFIPDCEGPVLVDEDISRISDTHRSAIFAERSPINLRWMKDVGLAIDWAHEVTGAYQEVAKEVSRLSGRPTFFVAHPDSSVFGFCTHKTTHHIYETRLVNTEHPWAKWLLELKRACDEGAIGFTSSQFETVIALLQDPLGYWGLDLEKLTKYLSKWRESGSLPLELAPPQIDLTDSDFRLKPIQ